MQLTLLFASFLLCSAAPADPEAAAARKVDKYQKQYEEYIKKTIKGRYSGCTPDKIIYRQEW